MEDLRGKVVLIDFWTYTCVNCIRTFPFLRDWHQKYADDGLVIVGVHAPEFEFEKVKENVEEAASRARPGLAHRPGQRLQYLAGIHQPRVAVQVPGGQGRAGSIRPRGGGRLRRDRGEDKGAAVGDRGLHVSHPGRHREAAQLRPQCRVRRADTGAVRRPLSEHRQQPALHSQPGVLRDSAEHAHQLHRPWPPHEPSPVPARPVEQRRGERHPRTE